MSKHVLDFRNMQYFHTIALYDFTSTTFRRPLCVNLFITVRHITFSNLISKHSIEEFRAVGNKVGLISAIPHAERIRDN